MNRNLFVGSITVLVTFLQTVAPAAEKRNQGVTNWIASGVAKAPPDGFLRTLLRAAKGEHLFSRVSPDGKLLAYCFYPRPKGRAEVGIVNLEERRQRVWVYVDEEYPRKNGFIPGALTWSPNSKLLYVGYTYTDAQGAPEWIPYDAAEGHAVSNGHFVPILRDLPKEKRPKDMIRRIYEPKTPIWSRDGRFFMRELDASRAGVNVRDLLPGGYPIFNRAVSRGYLHWQGRGIVVLADNCRKQPLAYLVHEKQMLGTVELAAPLVADTWFLERAGHLIVKRELFGYRLVPAKEPGGEPDLKEEYRLASVDLGLRRVNWLCALDDDRLLVDAQSKDGATEIVLLDFGALRKSVFGSAGTSRSK